MADIPTKVARRIAEGLKRFQPILESGRARDVNESDTVTIVTDILQSIFGYDKYAEITSEHAIRGTYCDLAIKLDGALTLLVEVKAIGLELKDQFVKQAVDYATNQGVEWVVLTNGHLWRAYSVTFGKPVDYELLLEVDLSRLDPKNDDDIAPLFLLSKEGWKKSSIEEYKTQRQAVNRFTIAAVILELDTMQIIRRELRRIAPDSRIEVDDVEQVLIQEVLKREVIEGDKAEAAKKLVAKASKRALRDTRAGEKESNNAPPSADTPQTGSSS